MPQHVLGVVAGGLGFLDSGLARRIQPCQQHGGLHLRRRDRQTIGERKRLGRTLDREGQPAAGAAREAGATGRERVRHPFHRPPAQAGVAGQHREDRVAAQDAADQPRRGSRIPHVEHIGGLGEVAAPLAANPPGAGTLADHLRAQRPHGGGGPQHVLAFQQARDPRQPLGQGPEHERPVADGLVPRHADAARKRLAAGCRTKRLRHGGGVFHHHLLTQNGQGRAAGFDSRLWGWQGRALSEYGYAGEAPYGQG